LSVYAKPQLTTHCKTQMQAIISSVTWRQINEQIQRTDFASYEAHAQKQETM